MHRFITRLFLLIGSLAVSLAMSLWWVGARTETPSRSDVVAALLESPEVRSQMTGNLAAAISSQEGIPLEEAQGYVDGLSPEALDQLIEVGYGGDLEERTAENIANVDLSDAELVPGLGALAGLRDLAELVPGFLLLALVASGAAFLFAEDRRRVLRRIGRGWVGAPAGVLLFSLLVPRFLSGREELWALVLAAWFDRDWDLRFPLAILAVGAACLAGSFLIPYPQQPRLPSPERPPSTAPASTDGH